MRPTSWLTRLAGLLACGLIGVGCGDDEASSSGAATDSTQETAEAPTVAPAEETTTEDSTSDEAAEADGEAVYDSCTEAIEGTAIEDQAVAACEAARASFESCASSAEQLDDDAREDALQICTDGAQRFIEAAEATSSPG